MLGKPWPMDSQVTSSFRFRLQLVDVAALVIGYGLAAVLFRAFWPRDSVSPAVTFFAIGFYIWLGLAMSGPLILLRQRPLRQDAGDSPEAGGPVPRPGRTWA